VKIERDSVDRDQWRLAGTLERFVDVFKVTESAARIRRRNRPVFRLRNPLLNGRIDHGLIGGLGRNPVAYMSAGAGGVPVRPMYFVTKSTFALI
jgi:hypothetical protein